MAGGRLVSYRCAAQWSCSIRLAHRTQFVAPEHGLPIATVGCLAEADGVACRPNKLASLFPGALTKWRFPPETTLLPSPRPVGATGRPACSGSGPAAYSASTTTRYSRHVSGTPFNACSPASSKTSPDPATRSFTVCDTST